MIFHVMFSVSMFSFFYVKQQKTNDPPDQRFSVEAKIPLKWVWMGKLGGHVSTTWRIIPVSKWLVTPIYKPFSLFGRGTNPT